MKLTELTEKLQEIVSSEGDLAIYLDDSTDNVPHCSLVERVMVNPDLGVGKFVVLRPRDWISAFGGPWQFDAEKYLEEHPAPKDEKKLETMRELFKIAAIPIDRGLLWRIAAEKSGMTVEELWFDMNRTNAFIGAAPFYGGDAEGFEEFMALQHGGDEKA